jgi:glycosyltransferase involved in cell wall biosynthesis
MKDSNFIFHTKCILLISPEPWNHIQVSKHHYAIKLAKKGNRVFFLNPPSTEENCASTEIDGIFVLTYKGFQPGLRYFPSVLRKFLVTNVYDRIEKMAGVRFDVIWSFDNSVFFDLNFLPSHILKISHIVDLNQDFQFERAAKSADICFCTTEQLLTKFRIHNGNAFKINHGFDKPDTIRLIDLPGSNKIKAIYAGNLSSSYLDWDLIERIATRHDQVDFIFLGPGHSQVSACKRLIKFSHCFFIGKVPANELLSYYAASDVLLLSYKSQSNDQFANPHKMMEYLGSGKTIVSTWTKEFENYRDLIQMSDQREKFIEVFEYTLRNLDKLNDFKMMNKRQELAEANTYEKQIERIEQLIHDTIV